MRHPDVLLLAVIVFNDSNGLRTVVLALGHNFDKSALQFGTEHDSMLTEQIVFEGLANHVTSSNDVALLEELARVEGVKPILVKGWHIDTTGHENTLGDLGNSLEWSLNSIKNRLEDT